jgi:hypothetical protein
MRIHECARCEGCGYVTGSFRWEIAWSRWARDPSDPQRESGFLEAHVCPDCGGTGALIEMDGAPEPALKFASRRGLRRGSGYAEHVAAVLRSQHRPGAN